VEEFPRKRPAKMFHVKHCRHNFAVKSFPNPSCGEPTAGEVHRACLMEEAMVVEDVKLEIF